MGYERGGSKWELDDDAEHGAARKPPAGGHLGTILLRPSQLFVARAEWRAASDGGPAARMPKPPAEKVKLAGGDGRLGFCAPAPLATAEVGGAALPAKQAVGPAMEPTAYTFVPALHVGVPTGGCGAVLRVSFARALLPQSADPADVPPARFELATS